MYVEKTYEDQFVENVRSTSIILANQTSNYLTKNRSEIEIFLDELLLNGNITFAKITLKNGTNYSPQEMLDSELSFYEDFYFAQHDDDTYFISAPIKSLQSNASGIIEFGFDETLVRGNIKTAYTRGTNLALGYFVLIIVLILVFIPRLTSSLRRLKDAAQKISSGQEETSLNITTQIDDFNSLIFSLESMRSSLVKNSKQIEKKEMYIRRIMNRMADAMIIMNKDMIIQSLNTSAENIFNYAEKDLIGKPFQVLLSPCGTFKNCDSCDKLQEQTLQFNQKENGAMECLGKKKSGLTFPVSLFYSNFSYDNELTIICNAHDMTEQKNAEIKLTDALEGAEEANKSKSIFLSSMSHELRTPLNAIIGYSEILLEDAIESNNEATSSDLRKIRNSGKHLLSLINNVLDLSKIEAGKMELDNQDFLIDQVIEDVIFTTAPLMDKNNNEFSLEYENTQTTMYSDFTKIKQALINLIGNAAKFTENGKITLCVQIENIEANPYITFSITDTGIGIAEEDIGKLFNEFSQANAQVMTKYGGSGLGLIISQKFCQMMGGDILVTSEINKGSTFTMKLPLQNPPKTP